MTQSNFSDPVHRLDNLSHGDFFAAYAILRHAIHNPKWADARVAMLTTITALLDADIAYRHDVRLSTLVGKLTDVANAEHRFTDAQDQAATPSD